MKGFTVVCCVLVAAAGFMAAGPAAAVTCGDVTSSLGQCLPFLRGQVGTPAVGCCDGVRRLRAMLPAIADRRVACNCMKQAAAHFRDIKGNAVSSLPGICRAPLPFPINLAVDCAR
ncbi:unnamed protein product [Spirodela intermedia]|uniref:Non-specific lipid-transfer protein n=2 Tax=Spirodela intermedia TaxID=51605 RepID=A0A7I8JGL8_SPIIN|nr:unnamed protein product [Spirodela intermedia]CAA6668542.1 unnamed protein product [Spirodela intermedia]CAA7405403.1 unnamed protein product [Spirodela intermedia]